MSQPASGPVYLTVEEFETCEIPDGMVVGEDPVADERRFYRSEHGITLVTRDMLAALA